jgi:hypothetical protein
MKGERRASDKIEDRRGESGVLGYLSDVLRYGRNKWSQRLTAPVRYFMGPPTNKHTDAVEDRIRRMLEEPTEEYYFDGWNPAESAAIRWRREQKEKQ